jgi:hypothetical protein
MKPSVLLILPTLESKIRNILAKSDASIYSEAIIKNVSTKLNFEFIIWEISNNYEEAVSEVDLLAKTEHLHNKKIFLIISDENKVLFANSIIPYCDSISTFSHPINPVNLDIDDFCRLFFEFSGFNLFNSTKMEKVEPSIDLQHIKSDYFIPNKLEESLFKNNLVGFDYCNLSNLENIKKQILLSDHNLANGIPLTELLLDLEESSTSWEKLHFQRVAIVSRKLLEGSQITEISELRNAQIASLFYLWPTCCKSEQITRFPYSRFTRDELRVQTIDFLNKNSKVLSSQFSLPEISAIVNNMSLLLTGKSQTKSKTASCILLADLIDREFWWNGYFDPRSCYQLITWLEKGYAKLFDQLSLKISLKFIIDTTEEFYQEKSQEYKALYEIDTVSFSCLRPKMKFLDLSGVNEYDLPNIHEIDADTIMNIWKIFLLRNIKPFKISNKNI